MSSSEFSTTDFYMTAILIAHKYEVKKISSEGGGGKLKRFTFDDSEELRALILKYMNRNLEGNLRDFRDAIETVKDMVHSG